MPLHIHEGDYCQKNGRMTGVAGARRYWSPGAWLAGRGHGAAAGDNSWAGPHAVKHTVTMWCSSGVPRWVPRRTEGRCRMPLFIVAPFTLVQR